MQRELQIRQVKAQGRQIDGIDEHVQAGRNRRGISIKTLLIPRSEGDLKHAGASPGKQMIRVLRIKRQHADPG